MTVTRELVKQTVVIVGASSGIGLATARAATSKGAKVVMISRSREKLDAVARSIQGDVVLAPADMLDAGRLGTAITSAGAIDHLVLTAVANEMQRVAPIHELRDEQIERSMDKLRGFVFAARAARPMIQQRGSIVLISGASALKPTPGMSVLASVNAAVTTFAKCLALELAPIRVNAITPGYVETPVHDTESVKRTRQWAESALPARRLGQPEDIADAILFLMTNPYMTGHDLVIDGGLVSPGTTS